MFETPEKNEEQHVPAGSTPEPEPVEDGDEAAEEAEDGDEDAAE